MNWSRELNLIAPDTVREFMATPFDHAPGTYFRYEQTGLTVLCYVVEQAVRQDLQDFAQALIEQVTDLLAARNERHCHHRRGGERLPGARGGVFTQKITDVERVLATILHSRSIATQDTLAELFEVSRRTIGNVVREVLPLLEQANYTPTPSGTRFATAAELLTFVTTDNATPPT